MDNLIKWYNNNKRDLPWRNTSDPYKIWLSEIILQQTRVEQGMGYYCHFIKKYPNIKKLALSDFDEVMHLWQGLGYYSRARNLLTTAKTIVTSYKGLFPSTFEELKKLKGIGDYTAAAIASIAFNIPVPVLDGNVFRVLSRYYAISEPIDKAASKKIFFELAYQLLDKKNPGTFNQAVMELGALICTPKQPKCVNCPVSGKCQAFLSHLVESFPVKAGKILQRNRFFYYLIISENEKTFIQKRIGKDIWEGLYQFPLIESQKRRSVETIITCREIQDKVGTNAIISKVSEEIKHVLSHQKIFTRFIHIETASAAINSNKNYKKVSKSKVSDFPMPRLITRYLENNAI